MRLRQHDGANELCVCKETFSFKELQDRRPSFMSSVGMNAVYPKTVSCQGQEPWALQPRVRPRAGVAPLVLGPPTPSTASPFPLPIFPPWVLG